jgi:plastocyanin
MIFLGVLVAAGVVFLLSACGGSEEKAAAPAPSAPDSAKLTILHVQEGCHIWSDGQRQAATMRLGVSEGGTLTLVNNDIDAHRLVQLAGPEVALGSTMMMGGKMAVVFSEPGVYRLQTETVEVEGMEEMMEVETEGPDNELELEVEVS